MVQEGGTRFSPGLCSPPGVGAGSGSGPGFGGCLLGGAGPVLEPPEVGLGPRRSSGPVAPGDSGS